MCGYICWVMSYRDTLQLCYLNLTVWVPIIELVEIYISSNRSPWQYTKDLSWPPMWPSNLVLLSASTFSLSLVSFFPSAWWRVIKWKHFPRYGPFVRGSHRSPVNSPHKGQWRGALMFSLRLNKRRLSKQSWGWWFETLSRPLWRHCNGSTDIPNRPKDIVSRLCQSHSAGCCRCVSIAILKQNDDHTSQNLTRSSWTPCSGVKSTER